MNLELMALFKALFAYFKNSHKLFLKSMPISNYVLYVADNVTFILIFTTGFSMLVMGLDYSYYHDCHKTPHYNHRNKQFLNSLFMPQCIRNRAYIDHYQFHTSHNYHQLASPPHIAPKCHATGESKITETRTTKYCLRTILPEN